MHIPSFTEKTPVQVKEALEDLSRKNVQALVIDKAVVAAPSVTYDLFSGRYVINNLPNEQGFIAKFGQTFPAGFFTPQNLQKLGRN